MTNQDLGTASKAMNGEECFGKPGFHLAGQQSRCQAKDRVFRQEGSV